MNPKEQIEDLRGKLFITAYLIYRLNSKKDYSAEVAWNYRRLMELQNNYPEQALKAKVPNNCQGVEFWINWDGDISKVETKSDGFKDWENKQKRKQLQPEKVKPPVHKPPTPVAKQSRLF